MNQDMPSWLRQSVFVLATFLSVVGVAGLKDDIETWSLWLAWLNKGVPWWLFIISAAFLFGLLVAANRRTKRSTLAPASPSAPTPGSYATEKFFDGGRIALNDLVHPEGVPLIEGKVFDGCHLVGPIILKNLGGNVFTDSSFDGSVDDMFYAIEGERRLVGVVGMKDCTVRRCSLHRVGMIGTPEEIAHIKRQLGGGVDLDVPMRKLLLESRSPAQALDEARRWFSEVAEAARAGSSEARAKFPEVARVFHDLSRAYGASGPIFQADYELIRRTFEELQVPVDRRMGTDNMFLDDERG